MIDMAQALGANALSATATPRYYWFSSLTTMSSLGGEVHSTALKKLRSAERTPLRGSIRTSKEDEYGKYR